VKVPIRVLPTLILNYLILSYLILYYLILYYLILSYIILSYLILYSLILSYLILSYIIVYYIILYYLILSYILLYYIILSYIILSYIIFGCMSLKVGTVQFRRTYLPLNSLHSVTFRANWIFNEISSGGGVELSSSMITKYGDVNPHIFKPPWHRNLSPSRYIEVHTVTSRNNIICQIYFLENCSTFTL
jgi:hypothetical protein